MNDKAYGMCDECLKFGNITLEEKNDRFAWLCLSCKKKLLKQNITENGEIPE